MLLAKTIEPQPWMITPQTKAVMKVLGGLDNPPLAMFVGGCVRNALIGKVITDIDIATIHRPDKVMAMLLNAGIRAIPTGLEHGTVTAIIDDSKFEITTLRKDVETDGRHAVISFTDQWEEDAQRRDFTINTLLASIDGTIYDPTGQGLSDLESRKVVFVGEPSQRIAEDYLRILRYFRFHGQYGEGAPDHAAIEACRMHAEKVRLLSKERVTQELFKILSLPNAADILALMKKSGVMNELQIKSYNPEKMERLCQFQTRYESMNLLTRLSLLSGFERKRAEEWIIFSNAQKQQIDQMAKAYDKMRFLSLKKIRAMVYEFGNQAVLQAYLLYLAADGKNPNLEVLDIARYWQPPVFPITGNNLIEKGLSPGRNLGKKLKALETKWIKSDFKKIPKI